MDYSHFQNPDFAPQQPNQADKWRTKSGQFPVISAKQKRSSCVQTVAPPGRIFPPPARMRIEATMTKFRVAQLLALSSAGSQEEGTQEEGSEANKFTDKKMRG
jgi:hypothetical protein